MPIDPLKFLDMYKVDAPEKLLQLTRFLEALHTPCALRIPNKEWVLEIQYKVSLEKQTQANVTSKVYNFGVSYDGWRLLVDFMYPGFPILQADGDEIDYLEIEISDILNSSIYNPNEDSSPFKIQ